MLSVCLKKPSAKSVNYFLAFLKDAYGGILHNPVNDARDMQTSLEALQFEVLKRENCTQREMKETIDAFGEKLKGCQVALFFYAGHGVQVKGLNYLIPVDAALKTEKLVEYDCVRADRVLAMMEDAGSRTNIVILDACRDNPFERSWRRNAQGSGLASMNAPVGSLIAYATAPGMTTSDGRGRNGTYTSALLNHIATPDLPLPQMFQEVRAEVTEKTKNKQVPWESTSLRGDFFMASNSGARTKAPAKVESKGTLSISCNVPDAAVYLDGREIGKTPLRISEVDKGDHQVAVEMSGYETYRNSVNITPGRNFSLNVRLKPVAIPPIERSCDDISGTWKIGDVIVKIVQVGDKIFTDHPVNAYSSKFEGTFENGILNVSSLWEHYKYTTFGIQHHKEWCRYYMEGRLSKDCGKIVGKKYSEGNDCMDYTYSGLFEMTRCE